ncbi:MAG TPA: hypothetical protein VMP01_12320 [Pirellulaceae bacterium]|nr:hypothetical protein [Pirellulaceae bacterium]
MQFTIRSLLVVTALVSVLCGIVFAAPPIVAVPILCAILWVCPAFWVNGIIFGRGAWRAFFVGGFMAGLVPHLVALYFSIMAIVLVFSGESMDSVIDGLELPWPNLLIAAILLAPGLFAFAGGLTGVCTWWMLQPAKAKPATDALSPDEYLIVSGRLTTTPVVREKV